MENNFCKICGSKSEKIFTKKILGKYNVSYFRCPSCGFIQTEKPYWFQESYSSAITSTDVGLVHRNIMYSNVVEKIIYRHFDKNAKFLDFAGGYGLFTRIMRDKGFDFYREDEYCENLFAKYFDIKDLPEKDRNFELITAFEVMEHTEDPFERLDYIFSMTDNFLFSTELVPEKNLEDWWYLGTEHGQHISFFTERSLKAIAGKYSKVYYSHGNLHLLSGRKGLDVFKEEADEIPNSEKLESRTWSDFEITLKKIKSK